jgi:hypothetical protein
MTTSLVPKIGAVGTLAQISTDANGQTALVGADGLTHLLTAYAGMVVCQPSAYIEIPNASPTVMEFDTVLHDPLGVYNAADNTFNPPSDIVMVDFEINVELANTTSTYGNATGNRSIILPAVIGMGTHILPLVPQSGTSAGGGNVRYSGFGIEWDYSNVPSFDVKFSQNSGSIIRIGDSTGTAVGQTYFKMRMYRAFA